VQAEQFTSAWAVRESVLTPTYVTMHELASRHPFRDLLWATVNTDLVCRVLYESPEVICGVCPSRLSDPNDFPLSLRYRQCILAVNMF
jgi:hypothetical protein